MNCIHLRTKHIRSSSFRGASQRNIASYPACDLMDENRDKEVEVKKALKENGVELKLGTGCPVSENKEWDKCPFYKSPL